MLSQTHCVYGLPGVGATHGPADSLAGDPLGDEDAAGRYAVRWDDGALVRLYHTSPASGFRDGRLERMRDGAWHLVTPDLQRLLETAGPHVVATFFEGVAAGRHDDALAALPAGPAKALAMNLTLRVSADRVHLFGEDGAAYVASLRPVLEDPAALAVLVAAGDQRALFAPPTLQGAVGFPAPPAPARAEQAGLHLLGPMARAAASPDYSAADVRAVLARAGMPAVHRLTDGDARALYRFHRAGGRLPGLQLRGSADFAAAEPFAFRLIPHDRGAGTLEARLPDLAHALLGADG